MVRAIRLVSSGPPNDLRAVLDAAARLGIAPPSDYVDLMTAHDGLNGFVGDELLEVYALGLLAKLNAEPPWPELPWLIHFGSDGSTYSYCFDIRSTPNLVVAVDFMDWSNVTTIASDPCPGPSGRPEQ